MSNPTGPEAGIACNNIELHGGPVAASLEGSELKQRESYLGSTWIFSKPDNVDHMASEKHRGNILSNTRQHQVAQSNTYALVTTYRP
jgi:hypothetical protein